MPHGPLNPQSIDFRAACNEALPASLRPIQPRVIERLCDATRKTGREAETIVGRIIGREGIPEDFDLPGDAPFWRDLAADPAWKTLVLEAVEAELSWSGLLEPGHRLTDWIGSAVEKWWDHRHPVTRNAGIAALSTLSFLGSTVAIRGVVHLTVPPSVREELHDLGSIPLKVEWSQPPALPVVKFDTTSLTLPKLEVDPALPKLELAQPIVVQQDSRGIVVQLQAISSAIAKATANPQRTLNPENLTSIQADLNQIAAKIPDRTTIGALAGKLDAVKAAIDQAALGEGKAETALRNAVREGALSSQLTLSENDLQSIVFPEIDAQTGQVQLVPLTVHVSRVSGSGATARATLDVSQAGLGATRRTSGDLSLSPGSSRQLSDTNLKLDATLAVNAIDRRWAFFHDVRVTITPNL